MKPGDTLEAPLLQFEIKEPGLHALSCSLSYWTPPRNLSYTPQAGGPDRQFRSFRKLYKFQVCVIDSLVLSAHTLIAVSQATNPLSVRTKAHVSKAAGAQLNKDLEHTAFLEVQIQNTSPDPLFFERLQFDASSDMIMEDLSLPPDGQLQPGDLLQCLYVIRPDSERREETIVRARQNGGIMPLGKLDIRWRNRLGDPGHLTTSQLVRRLPPMAIQQGPMSRRPSVSQAPPSNLLAAQTPGIGSVPSRDTSPNPSPRLGSAAFSPANSPRASSQFDDSSSAIRPRDLIAFLHVSDIETKKAVVGESFKLQCSLQLTSQWKPGRHLRSEMTQRHLRIAIQHIDYYATSVPDTHIVDVQDQIHIPKPLLRYATPTQSARPSVETERPLPPTPEASVFLQQQDLKQDELSLPPPMPLPSGHPFFFDTSSERYLPSRDSSFLGDGLFELEEIVISHQEQREAKQSSKSTISDVSSESDLPDVRISLDSSTTTTTDGLPLDDMMRVKAARGFRTIELPFDLTYYVWQPGMHRLGGVRVLLLKDTWCLPEQTDSVDAGLQACTLVEHAVVAEIEAEWA